MRTIGVEIDEHGLIPEAIEKTLTRLETAGELHRVKAIYVATYYDNPSSVSVPAERRVALVDIAQRWSRKGKIHLIGPARCSHSAVWVSIRNWR